MDFRLKRAKCALTRLSLTQESPKRWKFIDTNMSKHVKGGYYCESKIISKTNLRKMQSY